MCSSRSDPVTGRMLLIEMNPRVSRSSTLTEGYGISDHAKIAAQLAVGYTLDEIQNGITKGRRRPVLSRPSTSLS